MINAVWILTSEYDESRTKMNSLTAEELIDFLLKIPKDTRIQIPGKYYSEFIAISDLTYTTNFKDEHYLLIGNQN